AKYVYRVSGAGELIERGVFDRSEYKMFRGAEDFFWAVRCHMHFVTGRAEERLSFDIQREIAIRLGYTAHPGMRDVERFMKHYFAVHPAAMHAAARSLRLIDQKLREDKIANSLFFEILTSEGAEVVLRRMNEAGVLGRFVRAFGKIVAMMQFNMYHHYTVDEHLLRCIGILADIEAGGNEEFAQASELMRTIQPSHRALLYVALLLHDIAKGRV